MPRGRPKKTIEDAPKPALREPKNLTYAQQKWGEVIKFASSHDVQWPNYFLNGGYLNNPYIQNQRLKQINPTPNKVDRETLEGMMSSPSGNEMGLRQQSYYFFNTVINYFKLINMYNDMLTFRNYVTIKRVYESQRLRREYNTLTSFLEQIDVKRLFKEIMQTTLLEGKSFYWLRNEDKAHITLQQLPAEYCKIVHRYDGGVQVAFNLVYFMKAGVSPIWFGKKFATYIEEFFNYYDEENNVMDLRHKELPEDVVAYVSNNSNYYYWKFLPIDEVFVFSMFENDMNAVPPFMNTFLDVSELDTYKMLTQQLLSIPIQTILTAEVPFEERNKSGAFSNDTKISGDLLSVFQNLISSLMPPSTTFVAAPLSNFKLHTIDNVATKENIVGDAVQNFNAQLGTNAILSSDDKPSLAQVKAAEKLEPAFSKRIYPEAEYCLNTIVANTFKFKNLFTIHITGDIYSDDAEFTKVEKAVVNGQSDMIPLYLSFFDQYPNEAINTGKFIVNSGYYKNLRPLLSTAKYNVEDIDVIGKRPKGRPEMPDEEVSNDNTAKSKDAGTNKSENRVTIQKDFSLDDYTDEYIDSDEMLEKIEEAKELLEACGYSVDDTD